MYLIKKLGRALRSGLHGIIGLGMIGIGGIGLSMANTSALNSQLALLIVVGIILCTVSACRPVQRYQSPPSATPRPASNEQHSKILQLTRVLMRTNVWQTTLVLDEKRIKLSLAQDSTVLGREYVITVVTTELLLPEGDRFTNSEIRATECFRFNPTIPAVERTIVYTFIPVPGSPQKLPVGEFSLAKSARMESRRGFEDQFKYANTSELNKLLQLLGHVARSSGIVQDG